MLLKYIFKEKILYIWCQSNTVSTFVVDRPNYGLFNASASSSALSSCDEWLSNLRGALRDGDIQLSNWCSTRRYVETRSFRGCQFRRARSLHSSVSQWRCAAISSESHLPHLTVLCFAPDACSEAARPLLHQPVSNQIPRWGWRWTSHGLLNETPVVLTHAGKSGWGGREKTSFVQLWGSLCLSSVRADSRVAT